MRTINSDLRLTIPLAEFKEKLLNKFSEFNLEGELNSGKALLELSKPFESWRERLGNIYKSSFNVDYNEFYADFHPSEFEFLFRTEFFSLEGIREKYKEIHERINDDIKFITLCPSLYEDETHIKKLAVINHTVKQKLSFILECLYILRGAKYHSIERLLVWNGVRLSGEEEPNELGLQLAKQGLVSIEGRVYDANYGQYARITSKGEQSVEKGKIVADARENEQSPKSKPKSRSSNMIDNKRVFIVHGHDEVARLQLTRLLEKDFKLEPIILAEQPTETLTTIFGSLDKHARECEVAIVLLTPDDNVNGGNRARQNVILELGYFMGLYSPESRHIVILRKGDAEIPSDIHGVIRIDFKDDVVEAFKKLHDQFKHWKLI